MENKSIIKECKYHGQQKFKIYESKNSQRAVCLKCNVERVQKRRDKVKKLAVEYLGGKCEICNYSKCFGALEFHHKNPEEKDFGISMKGYTRSWEKVKSELDKCLLVCSNCHREIHSQINSNENESNNEPIS